MIEEVGDDLPSARAKRREDLPKNVYVIRFRGVGRKSRGVGVGPLTPNVRYL
jgi:hypothetical protein